MKLYYHHTKLKFLSRKLHQGAETMNMNHYRAGFNDAMAGCYDKWYRYNSKDNGFSYNCGFKAAMNDGAVISTIIECMH